STTRRPEGPQAMARWARGHSDHQRVTVAGSVVASLTPFGGRGGLPGGPQWPAASGGGGGRGDAEWLESGGSSQEGKAGHWGGRVGGGVAGGGGEQRRGILGWGDHGAVRVSTGRSAMAGPLGETASVQGVGSVVAARATARTATHGFGSRRTRVPSAERQAQSQAASVLRASLIRSTPSPWAWKESRRRPPSAHPTQ